MRQFLYGVLFGAIFGATIITALVAYTEPEPPKVNFSADCHTDSECQALDGKEIEL